jgi:hypothetical protein
MKLHNRTVTSRRTDDLSNNQFEADAQKRAPLNSALEEKND